MESNTQTCSTETEGLILSSFEVLQDGHVQQTDGRQPLKLNSPFLDIPMAVRGDHEQQGGCQPGDSLHPHPCGQAEGDEMFDVTDNDHFRGDETGDSLDNDTNNVSLEREDEGDDEDEEEDEDDEEDVNLTGANIQSIPPSNPDNTSGVNQRTCTPSVSDLRVHRHQQDGFVELTPHGYMDNSTVWHSNPATPSGGSRYATEWHIPLSSASGVPSGHEVMAEPTQSPGESREVVGTEEQHWKFVHGARHPSGQHHHWGPEQGPAKVVVAQANQNWAAPKRDLVEEHPHDLHQLDSSAHWGQHVRPAQASVHGTAVRGWHKDMGGVLTPEPDLGTVRNLFSLPAGQGGMTSSPVNNYSDMTCASAGNWNLGGHLPTRPTLGALPRPVHHHEMACRRTAPPHFYHQPPAQSYTSYQGQSREAWPASALSTAPTGLPAEGTADHYKVTSVQPNLVCKSAILNKRGKGRTHTAKCINVSPTDTPSKARPALDQVRQQSQPYPMKDQKKVVRDVYPATSANVHTLKASHIVSWYIDYLIHENEHLTQISRAFSLPVNLFHSDDFYFMDSLKKKVHFPSLKFLNWMQQNLPSINVNAIDFHEGRPSVVWNQDWCWQNKSRRDIIHDVFFYFQHRRVACEN